MSVTVRELYSYAVEHSYLDTEASVVLEIIHKFKSNSINSSGNMLSIMPNLTTPNDKGTADFGAFKDYTTEEIIELFNITM